MKKAINQKRDNRGGRRPGAGRPRVPKITATLTPGVLAQLVDLAEQQRRTPEDYAAHLLTQAVTAPLFQLSQETRPSNTRAAPCELIPGAVAAVQPHHLKLIDELEEGGKLIETGRDVWTLTTGAGSRKIDSRTIFTLRQKNMLMEAGE